MPYLCRSLSAKEPYNSWLFGEKWPATSGILWVFATLYTRVHSFINMKETDMQYERKRHALGKGDIRYTLCLTHSKTWHDLFISVARLIHMVNVTHLHVCHDSSMCMPCLFLEELNWMGSLHAVVLTHSKLWHDYSIVVECVCVCVFVCVRVRVCVCVCARDVLLDACVV